MANRYTGKYAPLSSSRDGMTRDSKRRRHATSDSSVPCSPHPNQGDLQFSATSRAQFEHMDMEHKLNCLFDMISTNYDMNYKLDCLNNSFYHSKAINDVTEARLRLLEYKSLDIEARSLRNNLIFNGFPECVGTEECTQTILEFLTSKLNMTLGLHSIVEARRIGRRIVARAQGTTRGRAILVTLSDPRYVNDIMDSAKLLKNTHFGISRDYPREISEARKELWPEFKAAREKYGSKSVKMLFPAALSVHGEVIRNLFPDWHSILRGSRNSDVASRVDQRFQKITADYAVSAQPPKLSTEPPKEPISVREVQSASEDESDAAVDEPELPTETPRRSKGKAPAAPKQRSRKPSLSPTKLSSRQPGYLMEVHPVMSQATPITSPRPAAGNTVIDNPTATVV
ncbi:hypothetical protein DPMN_143948 [Dreissena polymorpha]|uniref:Uncharacterized protein n=3 Tax=Dreissena polymorpha TaxID=45954 RepID=A0A9D4ETF5_DREPO|nr:hypothetical protein DPMN_056673 [Dreissena polymorpha]KAH3785083.1 hypothetical protein DPMN_163167 [Dreissena polymorpha]KAH3815425.1 hypothetical protein DPMN_143948 [Dreissena polymorpha]